MIKSFFKKFTSGWIRQTAKDIYYHFVLKNYLKKGRPHKKAETSKAAARREREGFFKKFCNGKGLDVGYGGDPVKPDVDVWDYEHGDAQYLSGVEDEKYDYLYTSHTIEHMVNPHTAIKNWFRVIKKGGYLLIYLPHRDLYEKKKTLPSRYNPDHKFFFLPDRDESPDTVGIVPLINRALVDFEIIYVKECSEGHTITDSLLHSDGEYSIEAVIKKI
jgi:SAM-dependent methyltransferase